MCVGWWTNLDYIGILLRDNWVHGSWGLGGGINHMFYLWTGRFCKVRKASAGMWGLPLGLIEAKSYIIILFNKAITICKLIVWAISVYLMRNFQCRPSEFGVRFYWLQHVLHEFISGIGRTIKSPGTLQNFIHSAELYPTYSNWFSCAQPPNELAFSFLRG